MPDDADHSSLAAHLRLVLWKASRAVEAIDQESIASTGLGMSDFAVLEVLHHKGPLPVNTVGRKVLLTSGSISTAVDRLEKRGLVRREPSLEDRRVCMVHLTGSGRSLIRTAFEHHVANLERAMANIPDQQKRQLIHLLKQLGTTVKSDFAEA